MKLETVNFDKISSILLQNGKPVLMTDEFRKLVNKAQIKGIKEKEIKRDLEKSGIIQIKILKSEHYQDVKRISIPSLNPTPYHYAVSLRGKAYLSHSSAVHLLGLTQQEPKVIYVNKEQSSKQESGDILLQENIDRAFSRPQRQSKYTFKIDGTKIILISGKSTGLAGVINDKTTGLPLTCLERTLIDITVRPRYTGGVFQVAQAFKEAVNEINSSKLLSIFNTLNYRYPYHQSLGFYLERAGAKREILDKLKEKGLKYKFYLDYSIFKPGFDESWRVFYPLGI
ncbi:MAG: hypothetical protein JW881_14490 [Spirochaetales bacterium]|nr:hypothetical protein [Spirochaetales bacterium]